MEVCARAHVIRIGLQFRRSRECWHRDPAIHPTTFPVVVCGHCWRGHELGMELCRDLKFDLARPLTLDFANWVRIEDAVCGRDNAYGRIVKLLMLTGRRPSRSKSAFSCYTIALCGNLRL